MCDMLNRKVLVVLLVIVAVHASPQLDIPGQYGTSSTSPRPLYPYDPNSSPRPLYPYDPNTSPRPLYPYDPSSTYRPQTAYDPSSTQRAQSPYDSRSTTEPSYGNGPYNVDLSRNYEPGDRFQGRQDAFPGEQERRYGSPGEQERRYGNPGEQERRYGSPGEQERRYGNPGEQERRYGSPGDIRALLEALDVQSSQQCTNNVAAQWNFETGVNQASQLAAEVSDRWENEKSE